MTSILDVDVDDVDINRIIHTTRHKGHVIPHILEDWTITHEADGSDVIPRWFTEYQLMEDAVNAEWY